ncbi:MAG: amino acid-binding protein [Firmicutes bacterium HGW-Firmicutes-2]|jgi:branched-chain amino acid transport system substrate-binding protein|nr:MAG: amino acid-binding protein [Firmicutes bacterium HGW-Firmicutes-2]
MKKLLSLALVLVIVLTTFLTGCAGDSKPTTPDATETGTETGTETETEASGEAVRLGLLAPTSGALAPYGQAVKNSVELAIQEINAAGGINGADVELFFYDNEGDSTKTVNLFNKLVDVDKIHALIGPVISTTSLAVAPIAEELGIPMISPTATNKDVTPGLDYVFRACYIDPYQGSVVAKFAMENLDAKTAAVFTNVGSDYSDGLAKAFTETFEAGGGTISDAEGYTDADNDFSAILTKVKANAPDVIFVPDYFNMVGVVASQVRELGIESILLGGDGWDGIQNDFASEVEGYFFANHYSTTDPDPIVQDYIAAYEAQFGETPNALGALAYDATNVMLAAIIAAGSTDGEKIIEALMATDMPAVAGHITFDENGDPIKDISIITVKDGKLELEAKVSGN